MASTRTIDAWVTVEFDALMASPPASPAGAATAVGTAMARPGQEPEWSRPDLAGIGDWLRGAGPADAAAGLKRFPEERDGTLPALVRDGCGGTAGRKGPS